MFLLLQTENSYFFNFFEQSPEHEWEWWEFFFHLCSFICTVALKAWWRLETSEYFCLQKLKDLWKTNSNSIFYAAGLAVCWKLNFLALACPALHKMSYASIDILEQASGDKNLMLTSRKMADFADWVVVNNMLAVDKLQDTIVSLFFLPTSPNPR